MILVLLGTQNNSFVRLLKEIERNIENGNIQDNVVVQAGYTKYNSNKMKIYDFVAPKKMEQLINDSSLIITHGGVGSTIQCVKKGKKVIAIPRLKKYGEHVNDHQVQLINTFDYQGYIIGAKDVSDLSDALKRVDKFTPKEYKSQTNNMIKMIDDYIDK